MLHICAALLAAALTWPAGGYVCDARGVVRLTGPVRSAGWLSESELAVLGADDRVYVVATDGTGKRRISVSAPSPVSVTRIISASTDAKYLALAGYREQDGQFRDWMGVIDVSAGKLAWQQTSPDEGIALAHPYHHDYDAGVTWSSQPGVVFCHMRRSIRHSDGPAAAWIIDAAAGKATVAPLLPGLDYAARGWSGGDLVCSAGPDYTLMSVPQDARPPRVWALPAAAATMQVVGVVDGGVLLADGLGEKVLRLSVIDRGGATIKESVIRSTEPTQSVVAHTDSSVTVIASRDPFDDLPEGTLSSLAVWHGTLAGQGSWQQFVGYVPSGSGHVRGVECWVSPSGQRVFANQADGA